MARGCVPVAAQTAPPPAEYIRSAQICTHYAVLSEGHLEVVEVRDENGDFVREYDQLLDLLSDNSTDREISNAYRRLARRNHPDHNHNRDVDPKDQFKMSKINDANEKVTEWRARGSAAAASGGALGKRKRNPREETIERQFLLRQPFETLYSQSEPANVQSGKWWCEALL